MKPKISDDEKALFRSAVKKAKPLIYSKAKPAPVKLTQKRLPPRESELTDQDELTLVSGSDYLLFARPGLQHKLLRKLKAGQYNIEAVLDLHGKTVAKAKETLEPFLEECQERHIKCVLMIHGKGQQSETPALKNRLNHWLRQCKAVMAFCTAQIRHGHTGAIYVLLKTIKEE